MTTIDYQNGNAKVSLNLSSGTRVIEWPDGTELKPDTPFNIDIRFSTRCSFGSKNGWPGPICGFCHESASQDGIECDWLELKSKLVGIPAGTELAIGANYWNNQFLEFLRWCKSNFFICNVTVNQGHLKRDELVIRNALHEQLVYGLGVSFRRSFGFDFPEWVREYQHTIIHVIESIDRLEDVIELSRRGIKSILVLGQKDFGFNQGKLVVSSWKNAWMLLDYFQKVSFDNLACTNLEVYNMVKPEVWKLLYQFEHSMYIDAANRKFHPSSRVAGVSWDGMNAATYFKSINK